MSEPILVVMAAGMGSRYGGLKQIDPVGKNGEIIMDYSLFDAYRAGFRRVIFIIKREREADFKEAIGHRIEGLWEVTYAFQDIDNLPSDFKVPESRVKPWGTGHAVLCCDGLIDAPFTVINADDFYGREAFSKMYQFLAKAKDGQQYNYSMVGYALQNTLTEHGHVARGVCQIRDHYLTSVTERTHIEQRPEGIEYTEDEGKTWHSLPNEAIASMNFWGFTPSFIQELKSGFIPFLQKALLENPLKAEYFLPTVVNHLIEEEKASVIVLESQDKWYGVTYKEDKPVVCKAIQDFTAAGLYPEHLW